MCLTRFLDFIYPFINNVFLGVEYKFAFWVVLLESCLGDPSFLRRFSDVWVCVKTEIEYAPWNILLFFPYFVASCSKNFNDEKLKWMCCI